MPVAEPLQRVPNEAVGLVPVPGFRVHRLVAFHEGAKVDRKRSLPDCEYPPPAALRMSTIITE